MALTIHHIYSPINLPVVSPPIPPPRPQGGDQGCHGNLRVKVVNYADAAFGEKLVTDVLWNDG